MLASQEQNLPHNFTLNASNKYLCQTPPQPNQFDNQRRAVRNFESPVHSLKVCAKRWLGDFEFSGDLLIVLAMKEKIENVSLSLRQGQMVYKSGPFRLTKEFFGGRWREGLCKAVPRAGNRGLRRFWALRLIARQAPRLPLGSIGQCQQCLLLCLLQGRP